MRIGVVFGSASDEGVQGPLAGSLAALGDVESVVLSAHRDPKRLAEWVAAGGRDLYVAGAGLAAHLPGVLASLTPKPVVGVPVAAALSGLDSLLSIVQMPFGVPVLSVGPGSGGAVAAFLKAAEAAPPGKALDLVVGEAARGLPHVARETGRLRRAASGMGWELRERSAPGPGSGARAINVVAGEGGPVLEGPAINVPVLPGDALARPGTALGLLERMRRGAWTGTNNTRNALLWWARLHDAGVGA